MEETTRLTEAIRELLDGGRDERLADVLAEAHPADVSGVIRELALEDQVRVFRLLTPQQAGAVLAELDDPILRELIGSLDEAEVSRALDRMEEEKAEEVQVLLEYREGTAGRLMSPDFVAVPETVTVARAIEHIRKAKTGDGAFYVYVVDDHDHLVGFVPLHRLITADPAAPIRTIRTEDVESVTVDTDQEEVARLVQRYNLIQVPVVDANRRLLGVIGVEDVLDVIREEATEDIQRLGGVGGDENVLDPPRSVLPKRLIWRLINLATAIIAASVIGLFEKTIAHLAVLAVFMPIVASEGGIATTQTATVVVRVIALGDLTRSVLWRVLWKEMWLALATGAVSGFALATVAYAWKGNLLLSLILGVALIFNMLVAAVVGTLIPIALKAFRIDPAIASSVIITTFTDVCGFFSFLGLATVLIRFLL